MVPSFFAQRLHDRRPEEVAMNDDRRFLNWAARP
jgi:hypothetical protein